MQIAVNNYNVALKNTMMVVCYYGFTTKREAERVAQAFCRTTGKEYVVIPWARRKRNK